MPLRPPHSLAGSAWSRELAALSSGPRPLPADLGGTSPALPTCLVGRQFQERLDTVCLGDRRNDLHSFKCFTTWTAVRGTGRSDTGALSTWNTGDVTEERTPAFPQGSRNSPVRPVATVPEGPRARCSIQSLVHQLHEFSATLLALRGTGPPVAPALRGTGCSSTWWWHGWLHFCSSVFFSPVDTSHVTHRETLSPYPSCGPWWAPLPTTVCLPCSPGRLPPSLLLKHTRHLTTGPLHMPVPFAGTFPVVPLFS